MKLFKCEVCGLVYEGEEFIEKCPKCDAPAAKHVELEEEVAAKIVNSQETNEIHMQLINLATAMQELCESGIDIGLDANCVKVFQRSSQRAETIKAMCRAELLGHASKGKF